MANKQRWPEVIDFSGGEFANRSGNGLSLLGKSGEFVNPKCSRRAAPAHAILTAPGAICADIAATGDIIFTDEKESPDTPLNASGADFQCRLSLPKVQAHVPYAEDSMRASAV